MDAGQSIQAMSKGRCGLKYAGRNAANDGGQAYRLECKKICGLERKYRRISRKARMEK